MTSSNAYAGRPFRFGIVGGPSADGSGWVELARRAETLGVSAMLIPDAPGRTPAAFPTLAWIAANTMTLHVGTYVLNSDLRHPLETARDSATLDALSGGRFELGLGAGRPGADRDYDELGRNLDAPGVRVQRFQQAVGIISDLFDGKTVDRDTDPYPMRNACLRVEMPTAHRPPLLIAGGGDRMLRFAAKVADTIALGIDPAATFETVRERTRFVRDAAAIHGRAPELTINLAGAGKSIHPWLQRRLEPMRDELVAARSPALVLGSPERMIDQLQRMREELGITYITAAPELLDELEPVIRQLA